MTKATAGCLLCASILCNTYQRCVVGLQVALAARNRKPRDDITVIVVDVLPPSAHDAKHPPLLARAKSGAAAALAGGPAAEPVDIFWPLTGEGATHWRRNVW